MKPEDAREPLPAWGEAWFKAWLVLLPLVVWASHALITNQWERTWNIVHPEEPATPPAKLWWYAAMVGTGFSVVYLGVARLFRGSKSE
jgi:hypothetical protein